MPIQILDRSSQGIIDALESGSFVSFDGDQQVLRHAIFKVPGNVIQLTNVVGRYYLPFETTISQARFFVATGGCNINLSVNGTSDFLLDNVAVTPTEQTANIARTVPANTFLQLDVVTANSGTTDLTVILTTTMPFESLLIQ